MIIPRVWSDVHCARTFYFYDVFFLLSVSHRFTKISKKFSFVKKPYFSRTKLFVLRKISKKSSNFVIFGFFHKICFNSCKVPLLEMSCWFPGWSQKSEAWSLELGAWNLELGPGSLRVGLGTLRCFLKIFLIFHKKKCSFFMQKKSVMSRFWSLRIGLQDWYVGSKPQVQPKSPSSKTSLDFMGQYYLLTGRNRTEKCRWKTYNYLKNFFFWKQKKKQWKQSLKKRTGRSNSPAKALELGIWNLELRTYTGRSFDISNQIKCI